MTHPCLIGIDWGTSSFRARLLHPYGTVADSTTSASGILAVPADGFETCFEDAVGAWIEAWPGLPILASGMITSRNGWVETPYLPLPLSAEDLATGLVAHETARGHTIHFVPGVARAPGDGAPDVMRGEETELVGHLVSGAMARGRFVLPGTHSKWAWTEGGRLTDFETAMTGEVYAVLSQHSILGRLMRPSNGFSPEAFARGLDTAASGDRSLLAKLFSARSLALFDHLGEEEVGDYLSGLLIGDEFAGARHEEDAAPLVIVGRGELADRYAQAAAHFGLAAHVAPPDLAAHGQLHIARKAGLI